MHVKELIQRKQNLSNIQLKVNNEKNILLINILKLTQKLNFYVNNSFLNVQILEALAGKYNIKSNYIEDVSFVKKSEQLLKLKNRFFKENELYIYLTEEQKYKTDSYSRYENIMLEKIKNKNIDFITIGNRAKEFASNNKLSVLKHFESSSVDNLASILRQLIRILFSENNYTRVHFVINSNKNHKNAFTILPISEFDVHKLLHLDVQNEYDNVINEYKIYPNIENFLEMQIMIFIENVINALITESSFYNAKNSLVTTNKKIKQLDEEIFKLGKKINRVKQEKQIEEIVLLTEKKKTIFHEGGK
ncbi:MSC_0622 family F1-like ATPase gamma subunit [Mycoplasma leonicaptivi]|uniref:MSC_0622 family F1-like ATPase gamma subunit n=1 Tax=Mycoplasma leonicaptivi TaxID=36742 RepID=UPI000480DAC2|nr:F0F1 ATP synthase subunit gamma [Mycoplasma leonicaptivi]